MGALGNQQERTSVMTSEKQLLAGSVIRLSPNNLEKRGLFTNREPSRQPILPEVNKSKVRTHNVQGVAEAWSSENCAKTNASKHLWTEAILTLNAIISSYRKQVL